MLKTYNYKGSLPFLFIDSYLQSKLKCDKYSGIYISIYMFWQTQLESSFPLASCLVINKGKISHK